MTSPRYSMTWPTPPATPILRMIARITSFAVTPSCSVPLTSTAIVFGRACASVCVASTCSTSDVPMPKASEPNAPCVDVWLSPQTIVMPGCVSPCSGPMMWTMPCRRSFTPKYGTPNSSALWPIVSTCLVESGSGHGLSRSRVGTLWSTVASVRSGRRTLRPASRRPSNACADVTSCTRWRSMYSRSGLPSARRTRWASQIFSDNVFVIFLSPLIHLCGALTASRFVRVGHGFVRTSESCLRSTASMRFSAFMYAFADATITSVSAPRPR